MVNLSRYLQTFRFNSIYSFLYEREQYPSLVQSIYNYVKVSKLMVQSICNHVKVSKFYLQVKSITPSSGQSFQPWCFFLTVLMMFFCLSIRHSAKSFQGISSWAFSDFLYDVNGHLYDVTILFFFLSYFWGGIWITENMDT